jgi:hypothetical protein
MSRENVSFAKEKYAWATSDYWVLGLCSSSGILKNKTFRKLDLFPSSGEGVGDYLYSDRCSGNRSSFRNAVFFRIPDDGESPETQ